MTLKTLAGPGDQSGRVRTSLERSRAKFIFEIFRFQEGELKKLALGCIGC
ncbi:hypothetical protein [Aliirhizobium cellulosilyticum]|jgi:hypothetical protein|uniref:Uncharacterized protein n=1 Tax=Aliirhizobium cellulosilyticum TaxID=393664 RepID=A0A7W6TK99_9HYPH|nr:hypothetical protein [Rhizobium cellulosilyticum]MBB4351635.1 hypothetical protein [Rhizobium cellulosilyticum]MBB4414887.1 hypothetical protein [Rhizobium cellulosilyticum]MBB4449561.1 hypothetical protein [Rhizobium cellulosilyticum]